MPGLFAKKSISVLIKNQRNYKLCGLTLLNVSLENHFIPSFNIEQRFQVLHSKSEKHSIALNFKGLYTATQAVIFLEKLAFLQEISCYEIGLGSALNIIGDFYISEYNLEIGEDDLLYFQANLMNSGKVKYFNKMVEDINDNSK